MGDDNNTAPAEQGSDYLDGGEGDDILLGNGGSDQLFGGGQDDILYGRVVCAAWVARSRREAPNDKVFNRRMAA